MKSTNLARKVFALFVLATPALAAPLQATTERFDIAPGALSNEVSIVGYLGPGEGCNTLARMHLEFTPSVGFDASLVELVLTSPVEPGFPAWVVNASIDLGWGGGVGTFIADIDTHSLDGPFFSSGGIGFFSYWELKIERVGGGGVSGTFQNSYVEIVVEPSCPVGTEFCMGDTIGACPCGNPGALGHGCANSVGSGARLTGGGSASLAIGSFTLLASSLPLTQPALFFQGTNAVNNGAGVPFGDGLRCAGGNLVRLEAGSSGATGELSIAVDILGLGLAPGQTRRYQAWNRDPINSPCGTGFNSTNGVEVVWMP